MGFAIEVHERISTIDRADWDRVVAQAGAPIFYRYDFLEAYERAPLQPHSAWFYLMVRERTQGSVVAVLPVHLHEEMDPLGILAETLPGFSGAGHRALLSHFWHCYDSRIPMVERSQEVLELLCSSLAKIAREKQADWYGFLNVNGALDFARQLSALGFSSHHMVDRFQMGLLEVPDEAAYMSKLSGKVRTNLRRHYRLAEEERMTVEILSPPFGKLKEVVEMCGRTAQKFSATSFYPNEAFAEFLGRAAPMVRIIVVRTAGQLIGSVPCFIEDECFHIWAAGMRYELTRFSPYYIALHEAIKFAISSGCKRIEAGRRNAKVKERFGFTPVPLYSVLKRTAHGRLRPSGLEPSP